MKMEIEIIPGNLPQGRRPNEAIAPEPWRGTIPTGKLTSLWQRVSGEMPCRETSHPTQSQSDRPGKTFR